MTKRAQSLSFLSYFLPIVIGVFGLLISAQIVRAEDVISSVDLSTLAISEEFGGETVQIEEEETDNLERHFTTDMSSSNGNSTQVSLEQSFATRSQSTSSELAVSAESSFLTLTVTNASDLAISDESSFLTASGGGGGGGGDNGDGGGGGGGGSRRRSTVAPTPETPLPTLSCQPFLRQFIKLGRANDPFEVKKLQAFLRVFEGFNQVAVTGFYDQTTYEAVKVFQKRYAKDVLTPWGISEPTGYVYITTLYAINNIYCDLATANNFYLRLPEAKFLRSPVQIELGEPEITGTTTPFEFIGPLPETPGDVGQERSLWQVAALGLLDLWGDWCQWVNLLLVAVALIIFYLWQKERKKNKDRPTLFDT